MSASDSQGAGWVVSDSHADTIRKALNRLFIHEHGEQYPEREDALAALDALVAELAEARRLREVPIVTFTDDETRELIRQRDAHKTALEAAEAALAEARRERDEALYALEQDHLTHSVIVAGLQTKIAQANRECDAAEESNARLKAALAPLIAACEPLMASKPTEVTPDGLLRYDWTEPLYAIQQAIGPARAALAAGTDA